MIFSTKQYEGVAIQCKHFDKAIHEELQLHGQNPQVFVRWKSKKPFRVGSGGDTFSFLANPSTLFSQDSFYKNTHGGLFLQCFSTAVPFYLTPLMFDKEAGDQVDYQHCGCCLWSWHFSLGFGFFGCLVLPVVGRMNSCTVLPSKGWKRGPKSSGCETEMISFYRAFCLPLLLDFFGQFFLACVSHPRMKKPMSLTSLP